MDEEQILEHLDKLCRAHDALGEEIEVVKGWITFEPTKPIAIMVSDRQSLKAFMQKHLGTRYDTPTSSREELKEICRELRDAIIEQSNGYWVLSAPGKPNARLDIICSNEANINFDFFLSWNKSSLIPADHMLWMRRGPNQMRMGR